jgi:ABC-2 type transport system permease protein
MMAKDLLPGWIQSIAYVNPIDWAVTACREAISANPDWATVGQRLLLLAVLALFAGWLATRAFRAYQRSL